MFTGHIMVQALPSFVYTPPAPQASDSSTDTALIVSLAVVLPLLAVAAAIAALLLWRRRRQRRGRSQAASLKKTTSTNSSRSTRARMRKQSSMPTGLTSFEGTSAAGSGEPNTKMPMPSLPAIEPSGATTVSHDTTPRGSTAHWSSKLVDKLAGASARMTPAHSAARLGKRTPSGRTPAASVKLRLSTPALPPTTDFTSDNTTGSFPTTTVAQALTSISSANPVDALEDALDTLYLTKQPFREHYEILSSVERRTGGQGANLQAIISA